MGMIADSNGHLTERAPHTCHSIHTYLVTYLPRTQLVAAATPVEPFCQR